MDIKLSENTARLLKYLEDAEVIDSPTEFIERYIERIYEAVLTDEIENRNIM